MSVGGTETGDVLLHSHSGTYICSSLEHVIFSQLLYIWWAEKEKQKNGDLGKMMIAKVAVIVVYHHFALFVPHKKEQGKWSSMNEKQKQTDTGSNEHALEKGVKWMDSRNMLASGNCVRWKRTTQGKRGRKMNLYLFNNSLMSCHRFCSRWRETNIAGYI